MQSGRQTETETETEGERERRTWAKAYLKSYMDAHACGCPLHRCVLRLF